ncbi:MAG: hypothetical protein DRP67_04105 [Candidatus Omnitrophota bacterium]|nr:MAG: hypothetical protein DRP67_04105 [Candidatus Omnitrophota bacterium]
MKRGILIFLAFITLGGKIENKKLSEKILNYNWKTYINREYGFEIKYPGYISPKNTRFDWADRMVAPKGKLVVNFIPCSFSQITSKEPYHSYTCEIRIMVNKTSCDEKSCLSLPFKFQNMKKEDVNINGIKFKRFFNISDCASGNRLKMEVYRTFHNNICFTIEKVEYGYLFDELERKGSPHFDLEYAKKFNICRKILEKMVSTFKFLK